MNTTPIIEHAIEMPIVTVDFLVMIAKKKKITAIAQNNGKERSRLFTAYINRSGKAVSVPSAKRESIMKTVIFETMIMVQPRI